MKTLIAASITVLAVTACASGPRSKSDIGAFPETMPTPVFAAMPKGEGPSSSASLWATSPNALLSMRRAKAIGDLLTVVVEMDDKASLQSSLSRSRDSTGNLNIDALLGLPEWANGVLPGGASLSPTFDYNRNSNLNGSGAVNRAEKITFTLAARVVGVEPNGNLIIQGYQQTRVSNEVRYLTVSGVIRAQDITRTNVVSYEKIADASLSYISRGEATEAVERKTGAKLLDWIIPF